MLAFGELYRNGGRAGGEQVVSSEWIEASWQPRTRSVFHDDQYGYGWFLDEQGGKYFPWHKGDYRGHTTIFVRQIHRQEVIVILSNQEETDVLGLRTRILRVLKANPEPQP